MKELQCQLLSMFTFSTPQAYNKLTNVLYVSEDWIVFFYLQLHWIRFLNLHLHTTHELRIGCCQILKNFNGGIYNGQHGFGDEAHRDACACCHRQHRHPGIVPIASYHCSQLAVGATQSTPPFSCRTKSRSDVCSDSSNNKAMVSNLQKHYYLPCCENYVRQSVN